MNFWPQQLRDGNNPDSESGLAYAISPLTTLIGKHDIWSVPRKLVVSAARSVQVNEVVLRGIWMEALRVRRKIMVDGYHVRWDMEWNVQRSSAREQDAVSIYE